jgi:hypothetical protein
MKNLLEINPQFKLGKDLDIHSLYKNIIIVIYF